MKHICKNKMTKPYSTWLNLIPQCSECQPQYPLLWYTDTLCLKLGSLGVNRHKVAVHHSSTGGKTEHEPPPRITSSVLKLGIKIG